MRGLLCFILDRSLSCNELQSQNSSMLNSRVWTAIHATKTKYTLIAGELKPFRPSGWIIPESQSPIHMPATNALVGKKRMVRVMLPMATQASTQRSCCKKRISLLCSKEAPSPQTSSREGDLHSPDKYSLLQKQELVNIPLTLCTYTSLSFLQSHFGIPGSIAWN